MKQLHLARCRGAVVLLVLGLQGACCKRAQSDAGPPSTSGERAMDGTMPMNASKTSVKGERLDAEGSERVGNSGPVTQPVPPTAGEQELRTTPGLAQLIRGVRRKNAAFRNPSDSERMLFRDWIGELSGAARVGRLAERPELPMGLTGWTVTTLASPPSDVWVVHEVSGAERGAGIVVLRMDEAAPLVIEAPHTFFDSYTLDIALSAFEALRGRALVVNTVHRAGRSGAALSEEGFAPHDVAHNPASFFAAAHEGLATALQGHVVLQLHGFKDDEAPGVQAILSAAGTGAQVNPLLFALRDFVPAAAVRHYPSQIRQLGGTTNAQARWSAAQGFPFIHLELSYSLRAQLQADEKLRWRFGELLKAAQEQDPP